MIFRLLRFAFVAIFALALAFPVNCQNAIPKSSEPLESSAQETDNVKTTSDVVVEKVKGKEASKTDTIPKSDPPTDQEEFGGAISGIIQIWKDAKADYESKKDSEGFNFFLWLIGYLIAAISSMKLVQFSRSWKILKGFFYNVDTDTLVKGISLAVAAVITLVSTGGYFDPLRYASIAGLTYILAGPVYNIFRSLGWVRKTEKVPTESDQRPSPSRA